RRQVVVMSAGPVRLLEAELGQREHGGSAGWISECPLTEGQQRGLRMRVVLAGEVPTIEDVLGEETRPVGVERTPCEVGGDPLRAHLADVNGWPARNDGERESANAK